jgi:murein DD-endopeptidase MepM/ murein hydrolase activator NlpD
MSPVKPFPITSALLLVLVLMSPEPAAATGVVAETHGVWPLRPRPAVVHAFDPPEVVWGSGHRGVDLAGTVGQPVRAALAGRISYVGSIAGVGVVVVDHGATRTTYQPVAARVDVGVEVAEGAVIGTLEWYGTHCLPAACLHWGLVEGDRYLDPLTLVGGPSPVRLLPLEGPSMVPRAAVPPVLVAPVRYGLPVPGFGLGT